MSKRNLNWRLPLRTVTSLITCTALFASGLQAGCASESAGPDDGAPPVASGVLTLDDARAHEISFLQDLVERAQAGEALTAEEEAHVANYATVLATYPEELAAQAQSLVESVAARDGSSLAEAAANVTEADIEGIPELYDFAMNVSYELAMGFGDQIDLGAVEQPLCIFAKITLALLVVTVIGLAYQIYRTENPPPPPPPPIPQGAWFCVRPRAGGGCEVWQCMLHYVRPPAVPTSACGVHPLGACQDDAGNPVMNAADCLPVAAPVIIN